MYLESFFMLWKFRNISIDDCRKIMIQNIFSIKKMISIYFFSNPKKKTEKGEIKRTGHYQGSILYL